MALALGKTIKELEDNLSTAELREWIAFSKIEPFGMQRNDIQTGILASTIQNNIIAIYGKNGTKKYTDATDFMPFSEARMSKEEKAQRSRKTASHKLRGLL